jgi:putative inorganic carbon (HCO3(-)) transporter
MVESVIGLREFAFNFRSEPGARVFATFFNPDITAGFLALCIPLCLALLWLDWPLVPAFSLGVTCVMGAATMALTASKGGWLALLAGLVVMGAARRFIPFRPAKQARATFWSVSALAVLAAGACSRVLLSRIADSGTGEANSAEFRKLVWESSIRMILHRPVLGFGAGAFSQAYPQFAIAGPTMAAHSGYLQAGVESGVVSLLFLVAVT